MRVLVLGAAGMQGRVAVWDLLRSEPVREVIAVDLRPGGLRSLSTNQTSAPQLKLVELDAADPAELAALLAASRPDVVIDLLPSRLLGQVAKAAIGAGCNLVNTMYGHQLPAEIGAAAAAAGVTIVPEAGLDPGIDLVLCGHGANQLDTVTELHSWCGGIPTPDAADNPLKYRVSWSWEGVLDSYARPAVIVRDGEVIGIPAEDQHAKQWVGTVDFPGVGRLEVIPNGDALVFTDLLGVTATVRDTTRGTYRWPGHSAFWRALTELGFLSDEPVPGLSGGVSPREFLNKHLAPRLGYGPYQRDMVVMRVVVGGLRSGRRLRLVYELVDRRDLSTGFTAMSRTVGFAASIVAQMVAGGEVHGAGLLTAVRDIPPRPFLDRLGRRGITVRETAQHP